MSNYNVEAIAKTIRMARISIGLIGVSIDNLTLIVLQDRDSPRANALLDIIGAMAGERERVRISILILEERLEQDSEDGG